MKFLLEKIKKPPNISCLSVIKKLFNYVLLFEEIACITRPMPAFIERRINETDERATYWLNPGRIAKITSSSLNQNGTVAQLFVYCLRDNRATDIYYLKRHPRMIAISGAELPTVEDMRDLYFYHRLENGKGLWASLPENNIPDIVIAHWQETRNHILSRVVHETFIYPLVKPN